MPTPSVLSAEQTDGADGRKQCKSNRSHSISPASQKKKRPEKRKSARCGFRDLTDDERSSGKVDGRIAQPEVLAIGEKLNPSVNDGQFSVFGHLGCESEIGRGISIVWNQNRIVGFSDFVRWLSRNPINPSFEIVSVQVSRRIGGNGLSFLHLDPLVAVSDRYLFDGRNAGFPRIGRRRHLNRRIQAFRRFPRGFRLVPAQQPSRCGRCASLGQCEPVVPQHA